MKAHVLAVPATKRTGARLVWHVRDILEAGWLRRLFSGLGGWGADRIICISRAVADQFSGTGAERRARIVYNGIRPLPFKDEEREAWRKQLGVGPDDVLVGIVGQIAWWKGQDVFIEAAAQVARRLPRARFAVIGECLFPENEAEFDAGIRRRTGELGIEGRVSWPGHAEPIEPLMAALDVLVHASRLPEPFGRVIIEALAQGTPVVTTNVGAGRELVPEDAGAVVPPSDPGALADAIVTIATDSSRRHDMAMAARVAADRFDIRHTGAGVAAVYDELTASVRPPRC
jgi:glycosyltransferase involved in cell wall biosynthesis